MNALGVTDGHVVAVRMAACALLAGDILTARRTIIAAAAASPLVGAGVPFRVAALRRCAMAAST